MLLVGEGLGECGGDVGGDEEGDVAAVAGDLFDEGGADVAVLLVGHDEDGFELGVEVPVHEGHVVFELEVGDGAETADDGGGVDGFGEVDEEAIEDGGGDVGELGDVALDHLEAFLGGEEGGLAGAGGDGDGDFGEEFGGAAKDVEVSAGDGVEGSWIDAVAHE